MSNPAQLFNTEVAKRADDLFMEWWALWTIPGTKRGRGHARKAFKKALKFATFDELCEGVKTYMAWNIANENPPRHIKHPATWLNAESWADDLAADQDDPFAGFTDGGQD